MTNLPTIEEALAMLEAWQRAGRPQKPKERR